MFVIGYTTALQRWKDNKPETITEHPLPDPKQLNAAIPVTEWEIGLDGKPRPPWKLVYVIYMIDLKTGAIFTYANSTYGAKLAYEHLEEQIGVMRMLRGEHVLPIVRLEKRPMKTQFGMKSRPHLQHHRLAYTGWWRSQAGTAVADSAAHWTGDGCGSRRGSGSGSDLRCSDSSARGSSCSSDRCSNPASVDGPRQHASRSSRSRSRNSSPTSCRRGPDARQ